ncbi:MAG: hypothetical protein MAG471_01452 [Acidimicrobiaceae bacterium]|nr:hypothetical protein [Acidimicrobiaceae bacterium]
MKATHDGVGIEDPVAGHEGPPVGVGLAHNPGLVGTAVEGVLYEPLQRRVLLFHHNYLAEATREVPDVGGLEGHRHLHVHDPDARHRDLGRCGEADSPESVEHLVVGEPTRDEADPGIGWVHGDPVEAIGYRVPADELGADLPEVAFHLQGVGGDQVPAGVVDMGPAVDLQIRHHSHHPVGGEVHRRGAVSHVGDDLESGPDTGQPAEGHGVHAEVKGLLHVAGVEDRHVQVDEGRIRTCGNRGTLRSRVVSDDCDCPTMA